jgi:uncharacterized membrane protein YbhN (UPF0104 family)
MVNKKIKMLLLLAVTTAGVYYFIDKGGEFGRLLNISAANILMASGVIVVSYVFYGLKFKNLFYPFNVNLAPREWFGLAMILHLGNLLFFKAGTVTMAVYLHSHYRLAYTKFIAVITAERIFLLYAFSLLGILFGFALDIPAYQKSTVVAFFSLVLAALTYILFHFSFAAPRWENRVGSMIVKIVDAWILFKRYPANIVKLILVQSVVILTWGLRFYIAFNAINRPISFAQSMALALTTFLTGFVNLVPGALGIREITVGLTLSYFGADFDYGVYAVTFDRILSTFWFSVLGLFYFNYLHLEKFQKDAAMIPVAE